MPTAAEDSHPTTSPELEATGAGRTATPGATRVWVGGAR